MRLEEFLLLAWNRYVTVAPDAQRILGLMTDLGETVVNDHIALRTFNLAGIGRRDLGRIFQEWGYVPVEDLAFPEKKLLATYYIHSDPKFPKVFISELLLEKCSGQLQEWVFQICKDKRWKSLAPAMFLEPNWDPIRFEDYERFYPESEYAAWTAAFGIQVNHFTVFVNSLRKFQTLQELNSYLVQQGFNLNSSGGIVKGTPHELLEQSSTMARKVPWKFAGNRTYEIMGCYYEFARRYLIPGTDRLFQGFIPKSADKIFESTFETQR